MLQQKEPQDFVIATGLQHSVRQFVEAAAKELGLSLSWRGKGLKERGVLSGSGKEIVSIDPRYFRPTEVNALWGDAAKARRLLGWKPRATFKELVAEMVRTDLSLARFDALRRKRGLSSLRQEDYH